MFPYLIPPSSFIVEQNDIQKIDFRIISQQSQHDNIIVHGFEENVSFEKAVRHIVPRTMRIIYIGDINKNEKISWIGDRPWSQIIRELAFDRNIQVQIDSSTLILIKQ